MGTMRTHNPKITPKVHMLMHHVPEYVRRTGIQLGPTSEQAPKSQHRFFSYFRPPIQSGLYKLPRLSRTFTECCITLQLVPFVKSRLTFCTLSPVFHLPRTVGRGKIVRKTLKTHITHHFMPLGLLLASFILTTIHVSLEEMSMK